MKANLYLIIILLSLLYSCKDKNPAKPIYRLTDDDKSWNIYNVGDTLKFLSNYNKKKNYFVENVNTVIINPTEIDYWDSYERLGIRFRRSDSVFTNNCFSMYLIRGYSGDSSHGFIIFMYWEDDLYLLSPFNLLEANSIDTLTVNNVLYSNVLKYKNDGYSSFNSAAKYIYYQKQKGWLRFELNSGETFDRIN